jgi:hypothetical protein
MMSRWTPEPGIDRLCFSFRKPLMMTSRKPARAIAIARTANDTAVYAFRLSLISAGAIAAFLVLLF